MYRSKLSHTLTKSEKQSDPHDLLIAKQHTYGLGIKAI